MSTLREHLEAAVALEGEWPEMAFGEVMDHVIAALALLDAAELERQTEAAQVSYRTAHLVIPDAPSRPTDDLT